MTGPGAANPAVHDFGGTGPPLLISHATGFHGFCYQPMADAIADRVHAVAFDYRGHGDTPVPEGWPEQSQVDWEEYADDAEVVALGLAADGERLSAFGHSMGGTCLLIVAHRHPMLFERLVLFEPIVPAPDGPGVGDPDDSPLVSAARRRRDTFGSREEAFANYANKPPLNVFHPDALLAYVSHGFADDAEGVRLKCSPQLEAATFAAGGRHQAWQYLRGIDVPVLVVSGRRDPDQGPALMAPLIAEELPRGSLLRLDRVDHFGPMSHPDLIGQVITDAMGGAVGRR